MAEETAKREFGRRLFKSVQLAGHRPKPTVLLKLYSDAGGPEVSYSSVVGWLNGRCIPTCDKLRVLASVLNVSATWLATGKEAA